tara:strand:- start:291 stop:593 length:303 start_codon:yes stop_codon:yes gene_type:complete
MYNIIENNFFNRLPIELVYKIINYSPFIDVTLLEFQKKKIKILKKLKKYMIESFFIRVKVSFLKENNYKMTTYKIHNELYYFSLDFTNMQNISMVFYKFI